MILWIIWSLNILRRNFRGLTLTRPADPLPKGEGEIHGLER